MRYVYQLATLTLALLGGPCHAASFGDQVADCLARKGVPISGPQFDAAVPVCEDAVRAAEDAIAAATADLARREWADCLRRTVVALDDGVSPIGEVAEALGTACRAEYVNLMRVIEPDRSPPNHARQREATRPALLPMVLSVRAERKKNRR